ncbi:MAG: hypothetical protein KIT31_13970 [Deltaproteobacteria bacterium]|nr:hypothetical protein [Deltaproteobacteria bacterium]
MMRRALLLMWLVGCATDSAATKPTARPAAQQGEPMAADSRYAQYGEFAELAAFFDKFVDTILAHKGDCEGMARGLDGVIEANLSLVIKTNAMKDAGKRVPPALEEQMRNRIGEMMPAIQECGTHPEVQDALKRMETRG